MNEQVRMVVVLTLIAGACALGLSVFKNATAERIENNILKNVQGPAVQKVLEGSENDLLADRRKVEIDGSELLVFVGKKSGRPWAIAYQCEGTGFGGEIGVMVGFDLGKDILTGIQIVSHKETPGVGSKVTEPQFTKGFSGLGLDTKFSIKADGGDIEAVTGATYSSRGTCEAVRKAVGLYPKVKAKVVGG